MARRNVVPHNTFLFSRDNGNHAAKDHGNDTKSSHQQISHVSPFCDFIIPTTGGESGMDQGWKDVGNRTTHQSTHETHHLGHRMHCTMCNHPQNDNTQTGNHIAMESPPPPLFCLVVSSQQDIAKYIQGRHILKRKCKENGNAVGQLNRCSQGSRRKGCRQDGMDIVAIGNPIQESKNRIKHNDTGNYPRIDTRECFTILHGLYTLLKRHQQSNGPLKHEHLTTERMQESRVCMYHSG
mmetsp:Transcript_34418/g.79456  ORF Transcript_34418/g.79456 Transcript_34418/m.79456 type:complete len:238 (-) Transcript_34418:867-1580(-)